MVRALGSFPPLRAIYTSSSSLSHVGWSSSRIELCQSIVHLSYEFDSKLSYSPEISDATANFVTSKVCSFRSFQRVLSSTFVTSSASFHRIGLLPEFVVRTVSSSDVNLWIFDFIALVRIRLRTTVNIKHTSIVASQPKQRFCFETGLFTDDSERVIDLTTVTVFRARMDHL